MTATAPRVELHFHALHGVDDGPATVQESLELLRLAVADGTETVVVTPHVRSDFVTDVSDLPERVRELGAAAQCAGIAIELRTGAELGHEMVAEMSQPELESVAQGPPGARWMLVEAPFADIGADFHAAADELRERGFGVLIGHPERSADAALEASAGLRRELRAGALAQLNAQSITGDHGAAAREAAFTLVDQGLASAVSSDAHGPTRPPLLGEARSRLVERGVDPERARILTGKGPRRLLFGGIAGRRSPVALVA